MRWLSFRKFFVTFQKRSHTTSLTTVGAERDLFGRSENLTHYGHIGFDGVLHAHNGLVQVSLVNGNIQRHQHRNRDSYVHRNRLADRNGGAEVLNWRGCCRNCEVCGDRSVVQVDDLHQECGVSCTSEILRFFIDRQIKFHGQVVQYCTVV